MSANTTSVANSTTVTIQIPAGGVVTGVSVPAPVETIDTIDWRALNFGSLSGFLARGWVWVPNDGSYPEATAALERLGWSSEVVDNGRGRRYNAPTAVPTPENPLPVVETIETVNWADLNFGRYSQYLARGWVWVPDDEQYAAGTAKLLELGWTREEVDNGHRYQRPTTATEAAPVAEPTDLPPFESIDWTEYDLRHLAEYFGNPPRRVWIGTVAHARAIELLQRYGWTAARVDTRDSTTLMQPPDAPVVPVPGPSSTGILEPTDQAGWLALGMSRLEASVTIQPGHVYLNEGTGEVKRRLVALMEGWGWVNEGGLETPHMRHGPNWPTGARLAQPEAGPARDAHGRFTSKTKVELSVYEALLKGSETEKTNAINTKALELAQQFDKSYQVWVVIDGSGNTSYLDGTGQRVKSVGQIIDVSSNTINMCRPGTLGGRFLYEAWGRNHGNEYKRAARVQLYGRLVSGGDTFRVSKGLVLGIISLDELRAFINPSGPEAAPEPELTLVQTYEKLKANMHGYRTRNGQRVDAIRNTEFDAWIELAGVIERGDTLTDGMIYRVAYLTQLDSMTGYVDMDSWFAPVEGVFQPNPELVVAGVKAAATRLKDGWKEEARRAVRVDDPLTSDRRTLEVKAREFFLARFPGIAIKDAGLKKGEDTLNPQAQYASVSS